ncbi:hypothetical protein [Sphaerospermopsis torques-reginae]|jgi:hypothetical protein|uniref:Uncharacterized protein n=1 Tax=Sphaerospermopsis torques-reginae ITEP-024 TaxID=984208 RepID=A0ABX8WZ24_9CYAN|nr:hypothetical protein [Sphaerospermopsis torques-reginae]QYX31664.1 hypothetical protein K2F26_23250 [Sphaerospermopsis torques-reginae ITEP-024]
MLYLFASGFNFCIKQLSIINYQLSIDKIIRVYLRLSAFAKWVLNLK